MKKLTLLTIILFSLNNFAQQSIAPDPTKELGAWYMYKGSHQISDKFSLKSMVQFRFFEIGDDMQQFIVRLGGNYKFSKTISAAVGYVFLNTDRTFNVDAGDFNEHRIYEDLNVKHKIATVSFTHRLRGEQRFFESTTGNFLRYQIALSQPINEKWSAYLYDETFLDFEGESYNQNWLGAGFKYKVSTTLKLQAGYQLINVNEIGNFNRILLGVAISTNHRK
ncbi:DUF2490 domain-containing protein [Tenacibaculum tangerinum]|uniref:DUF2490 domain-containing protein n=1 Tax=Tenacibaculum tangerinum TaxID=3038772 RepID=A0ABY8L5X7_9FLAO|nr:DUF2490 domain-containing protein [Tenacibaculum tangerinum]WGH76809.1 DUF2490 domain-containing protein [Tenacibaculum tangerinum]